MKPCVVCGRYTNASRCPACYRQKRAKYGAAHKADRTAWSARVATGTVPCWRCGQLIDPAGAWDLGHRGNQPSSPEHAACNRAAH